MQNSNEQMRRDFEEACQKAGLNPARRTLGGRYALDIVEHMWLGYQLSHTSAAEKQSMKERNYLLRIQDLEADVQRLTSLHNKAAEKYKGVVEAANLIEKWMQKHCMNNPYVAGFKKQVLSKLRQALTQLQ